MKINIVTSNPESCTKILQDHFPSDKFKVTQLKVYGNISCDYEILPLVNEYFTASHYFTVSLEGMMELADDYKPWDIRFY